MPIFQVEIFTPRKVSVVMKTKKAVAVVTGGAETSSDKTAENAPAASPSTGTNLSGATLPSFSSQPGTSFVNKTGTAANSAKEPTADDDKSEARDGEGAPPPPLPPADPDETRAEKHDAERNETYEVVFRVETIRKEDDDNTDGARKKGTTSGTDEESDPSPSAHWAPIGDEQTAPAASQVPQTALNRSASNSSSSSKAAKKLAVPSSSVKTASSGGSAVDETSVEGGAKAVRFAEKPKLTISPPPVLDSPAEKVDANMTEEPVATSVINLEEELRALLLECIPGVRTIWNRCNSLKNLGDQVDDNVVSFLQVTFYTRRKVALHILNRVMNEIGIGKDYGHVAMTECSYFRPIIDNTKGVLDQQLDLETVDNLQAQVDFDNVLNVVDGGATLTFDFVAFLIIAAIIAGTGLGVNSTVSVVASMLVSPMMGPILATVMGTVLFLKRQGSTEANVIVIGKELLIKGFLTEVFCLVTCVFIGFIIGLCFWRDAENFGWGTGGTTEMQSRTAISGLVVGLVIAIPSGAGVALSLLGSNGNSLVGVAISASLLPPAVNCGLYWAFAIRNHDTELVRLGAISLCLTSINVLCIYFSALATFYVKRSAPLTDASGRPLTSFLGITNFDQVTRAGVAQQVENNLRIHGLTMRGMMAKLDYLSAKPQEDSSAPAKPLGRLHPKTPAGLSSSMSVFHTTPLGSGREGHVHQRSRSSANLFGLGGLSKSHNRAEPFGLYFVDDDEDDEEGDNASTATTAAPVTRPRRLSN